MKHHISLQPIGIIHTPFTTKDATPIQGSFSPESKGMVEIYDNYENGLKDIESFSHIILIYYFDQADAMKLVRPTFLDDEPHGVFASRHPCRPNGIGLTVVKLITRHNNILEVQGIDVLDSTPLLDIKPYIPRFDSYPDASEGWLTGKNERQKPRGRD